MKLFHPYLTQRNTFAAFILIAVISLLFVFNGNSITPSFYYWRTNFTLSKSEKDLLQLLNIKKIYIRFFDVDIQEGNVNPVLLGKIIFPKGKIDSFMIVPVIYVTTQTLRKTSSGNLLFLSEIILSEIKSIAMQHKIKINEIQIDCDWTEKTKDEYFILLNILRRSLHSENQILTSTIRLHQIKYFKITGIPPVDRGMLMFYNMGSINTDTTQASIYNPAEAKKYVNYINDYPLTLDVALPIFSQVIHIRNGRPVEILSKTFLNNLLKNPNFSRMSDNYYKCDTSFFFHGQYFMKNDSFKIEQVNNKVTYTAALLLEQHLTSAKRTISLFDLDERNINRYKYEDFEKIFGCFR